MSEKNIQQDRPAFHGSDIEQIEQYYKIPAESIIKFGANVNPLGLSATLKKDLAEHLDVIHQLSGPRLQRTPFCDCGLLWCQDGTRCNRQCHRTDISADQ